MSAGRICSRTVATAAPKETVRVAARRMAENDVGTLVILAEPDGLAGVVTDRDITVRCVATGLDPDLTPISVIMSAPPEAIDENTPIEEAVSRMASAGVRRLAVTGAGQRLVGLLSLDDVLDLLSEEAGLVGRVLKKQQPHLVGA